MRKFKFRKITALVFVFAMMIGMSGNVFAEEMETYDVEFDSLNSTDYEAANQSLVNIAINGRHQFTYGQGNSLGVTHYFQDNQPWSGDLMKTQNLTIGSAGCTLTSFTMIADYLVRKHSYIFMTRLNKLIIPL